MKLSDVMGAAELSIYAEVGLVLFLLAFLGVVVRVISPRNSQEYSEARLLPLDDELTPAGSTNLRATPREAER